MKFYTIGCPACNVLESKLIAKGIKFEKIESEDAISKLGFDSAPLLEVDGKVLEYRDAVQYVNNF